MTHVYLTAFHPLKQAREARGKATKARNATSRVASVLWKILQTDDLHQKSQFVWHEVALHEELNCLELRGRSVVSEPEGGEPDSSSMQDTEKRVRPSKRSATEIVV